MPQNNTNNNPQQIHKPGINPPPFRMSLQLPENKLARLQAHEQKRSSQTQVPQVHGAGAGGSGKSVAGNSNAGMNQGNMQQSMGGNGGPPGGGQQSTGGKGYFSNAPMGNMAQQFTQYMEQPPENYHTHTSPVPPPYPYGLPHPEMTQEQNNNVAAQAAQMQSMQAAMNMNMLQAQMTSGGNSGYGLGGGLSGMGTMEDSSPGASVMDMGMGNQGSLAATPMATGPNGPGGNNNLNPGAADPETFEFMKRKRWPQLLMQELVGAAVWCLIPFKGDITIGPNQSSQSGWKIIFASPASHELLGYKPEELEGRDWADFVYGPDQRRIMQSISSSIMSHTEPVAGSPPSRHFQLSSSRSSAFNPPIPPNVMPIGGFVGPTKSFNVYTRMLTKDGKETLFELRGHPYFGDEAEDPNTPSSPGSNAGFDGGGVMGTTRGHRQSFAQNANHIGDNVIDDDERPCKAFWIMGRKWAGHGDGGAKMLDSFLELKMENERLKQELRDMQNRPYVPPVRTASISGAVPGGSTSGPPSSVAARSDAPITPYMGGMDSDDDDDDDDDDDLNSMTMSGKGHGQGGSELNMHHVGPAEAQTGLSADDKKIKKLKGKNPEYLCRNCGRNDSPEWRKGPLGPKTLCNACGLRWAKRNAGNIPRRKPKDKEKDDDTKPGLSNSDYPDSYPPLHTLPMDLK